MSFIKNKCAYLCIMALLVIASACATDLSDQELGGTEAGLDYSIDAVESSDLLSDEENEDELESLTAKPAGRCVCNPPPDSTGSYVFKKETCSLCTNSADCATASCIYEHNVHGGEKDVKCHFETITDVIEPIDAVKAIELEAVENANGESSDQTDESLEGEENIPVDLLGPKPEPCFCNPPPDSSENWGATKETCSKCEKSSDCATATCQYRHTVHGGLSVDVGCRFSSKIKRKLKKWKKKKAKLQDLFDF